LDGALELVGGIVLWIISPRQIVDVVRWLTYGELTEDPRDLIANYLRRTANHFSLGAEHFLAIYLLVHGIVKLFVVVALFRNRLWAYPVAIFVFGGFILYQTYQFALTHSAGLIVLTVFDLIVIWLIWLEFRAIKSRNT
jgi:uncharacterized membrane protein